MSWYRNNGSGKQNNRNKGKSRKKQGKSKYSNLERLAFQMGMIESGLGGDVDTRVKDSFAAGCSVKARQQQTKKPLI